MTSITRKRILRGPCKVLIGATPVTLYSKDDVVAKLALKTQAIQSSAIGQVFKIDDDVDNEITFTQDGQVTDDILAKAYPYCQAGIYPGTSVYGATDQPLVIWTRDGYKYTFPNAAVTKQPQFTASAVKTPFGQITIVPLRAMGADWSDEGSIVVITKEAYPGDSDFNASNIITAPFDSRWKSGAVPTGTATASEASPAVFSATADGLAIGDTVINTGYTNPALNGTFTVATTPTSGTYTLYQEGTTTPVNNTVGADSGTFTRADAFDSFETESGWTIDANATLKDEGSDSYGVLDKTFQMMVVTAKCTPIGPYPDQLIAAFGVQGSGARRGRNRAGAGADLYLSGMGIYAKLTGAAITDMQPVRAGGATKRIGEVTWEATMSLTDGAPNSPLQLSASSIA